MAIEYIRHARLLQMKRDWGSCFKCPLASLRTKVVMGGGIYNAPIMLIGEAPGPQEDMQGVPFVPEAAAGELLNKILAAVGLTRDSLWITNVCLCRPKSTEEGRDNRSPTTGEIAACSPRLLEEIDIVRPKIIVLCGNTPLFWATGLKGIKKHRGKLTTTIKSPSYEVKDVFATYHPAALFHGSHDDIVEKKWAVYRDWQQIAKEANLDQQQSPQDEVERQEKSSVNSTNS